MTSNTTTAAARQAMTLSIITPVFNGARFIQACIDNVAEQPGPIVEHIIVDGGSTDGTLDIVERALARSPRLRLLPGPDKGQSDAMNKGIRAATGDAIGILNVDDFYEPGAVADACARLQQLAPPALVVGDCRVLDQHGETLFWNRPKELRLEKLLLGWRNYQFPCNPSAYFYHKSVHDVVGPYDEEDNNAMDLRFILSCVRSIPIRYVDRHWGNFRLIPGAKTFEDVQAGVNRSSPIMSVFASELDPIGRLHMKRFAAQLWARRKARRLARGALRRLRAAVARSAS